MRASTGTQQVPFKVSPPGPPFNVTDSAVSATNRIDWLASVRGRIGTLWGPGLLYFTGGGAWEGVKRNVMVDSDADISAGSFSSTRSGFVVGGGYEWMLAQHWTARAEYLFYGFSNADTDTLTLPNCVAHGAVGCNVLATTGKNNVNAARFGVNYKF